MRSEIYWIDECTEGRLAIMARPRSGDWLDDEIAGWKAADIGVVVSLLDAGEVSELGLGREAEACRSNDIAFVAFPIEDRGVPSSLRQTQELVEHVVGKLQASEAVAVHCRAGIGRSSLIAACVLVRLGWDAHHALAAIARCRGLQVPDTDEQRHWVTAFAAAPAR